MADEVAKEFDANVAVFVALAHWVAERDGITADEAAINLGNLFSSDEVQNEIKEEEAAKDDLIQNAVKTVEDAFTKLRTDLGL